MDEEEEFCCCESSGKIDAAVDPRIHQSIVLLN